MKNTRNFAFLSAAVLCAALLAFVSVGRSSENSPEPAPAPAAAKPASEKASAEPEAPIVTEKAVFAAGCFWGVEERFRTLEGVLSTRVGYTGGTVPNVTYKQVCHGDTNHAEAVEIVFDPEKITYEKLLKIFFDNHNPTTWNRQGPDFGTQYRSAVFYQSPEQKAAAEKAKRGLAESGKWGERPIVTQIVPAAPFWEAEEYHQQYLLKRGLANCH